MFSRFKMFLKNFVPIIILLLFLCLHQSFVEKQRFFEKYEVMFQSLKQSAEAYASEDSSGENFQFNFKFWYLTLTKAEIKIVQKENLNKKKQDESTNNFYFYFY